MNSKKRWTALLVLSLAGFFVSAYQTWEHIQVRAGVAGFNTICSAVGSFDCESVILSPYAEFIPGLPLATLATVWYLAFFLVLLIGRDPFWRRDALRASLLMSGVGVVFSVVFFVIMATVIRQWCLLCLVVDAINLVTLGLVLSLKPEGTQTHPLDRAKWKSFAYVLLGAFCFVGLAKAMVSTSLDAPGADTSDSRWEELADSTFARSPESLRIPTDAVYYGSKDAPVTIVKFSDYQCPSCKMSARALELLIKKFPGKVKVVVRNYPLNSECNREVQADMHPAACVAARYALCAARDGKFQDAYEAFYEHQDELKTKTPAQVLALAGLPGSERWGACAEEATTRARLTEDVDEAVRLNIQATPTHFINGYRVQGNLPLRAWEIFVQRVLSQKN